MTDLGTPAKRLLDGLWAGSGRTLVIAGPPMSGKSALMERIRQAFVQRGGHIHTLRGEHRFRDLPFATMETLDQAPGPAAPSGSEPSGESEDLPTPMAGLAFVPLEPDAAPGRGRRGSGRARGTTHLLPPSGRNPIRVEPEEFWRSRVEEVRDPTLRPVLLVVEEGSFVDAESREVLLYLSDRARLRPIGLLLSLDSAIPAIARWEEHLVGRSDVDWIRLNITEDPREVRRAQEAFDALPAPSQRVLAMAALLGGHVSEVTLSRVTRLTFNQLAEALLPAVEAGHVRVQSGRVEFVHASFVQLIPARLGPPERSEMHREVAEALAALHPEPSLEHRIELARHYFEWYKGPNALRYLLETAELTERLHAFDTTIEALAKALECVPSLPAPDRGPAEAEIRFLQVRALAFAGLLGDAEHALREGVTAALAPGGTRDRLEEWVESLVPTFVTVGPRPSLVTQLLEAAERCHEASMLGVEIILQSVIARDDLARGRTGKAREEARRAARLASGAAPGVPQAMALLAVGLSRTDGDPAEQAVAGKFLETARRMFAGARRYALELEAESAVLALQQRMGEGEAHRKNRERALEQAERTRNLPVELDHRLALAELLIDEGGEARSAGLLRRAREITEMLHLVPPAPMLLRLWTLEGRAAAAAGSVAAARDRLLAVADQAPASVPATVRAEAHYRLAVLESSLGGDEAVRPHLDALARPELRDALPAEWLGRLEPLRARLSAPVPDQAPSEGNTPGSSA